jgi:hypothetical protein
MLLYSQRIANATGCLNIILKSHCLNHDNVAVHLFKSKLYSIPSAKLEDLRKIYPFSDDSALWYRNNLCYHTDDFNMEAK